MNDAIERAKKVIDSVRSARTKVVSYEVRNKHLIATLHISGGYKGMGSTCHLWALL